MGFVTSLGSNPAPNFIYNQTLKHKTVTFAEAVQKVIKGVISNAMRIENRH